jgi:GT2 family glycosyltransferase
MSRTGVILVSYRGANDTAACVHSLLEADPEISIVVVDTTPFDKDLGPALMFAPRVTLLRAAENVGFGRGNNLGIDWVRANLGCEFVFLLNNDTAVRLDSIQNLERVMDRDPALPIATPRIAYLDRPDTLWYGGGEIDWRHAGAVAPGFDGSATAPLAMKERNVTFASGCALFFRKEALAILGGFDPRFFMYGEDAELCLRAAEAGMVIRYVPTSLILHRVQGTSKEEHKDDGNLWSVRRPNLPFYAFHVIRNYCFNIFLHARGKSLIVAIVFFPLYLVRRAVPFILGNRWDAVWAMFKGIADFWRHRNDPSMEPSRLGEVKR